MDAALIGLVGVIAGSLVTGGVQAWLGVQHRKTQARASARILFSDLWLVETGINEEIEHGSWDAVVGAHLKGALDRWSEHNDRLASALNAHDFHTVAGAFAYLSQLLQIHNRVERAIDARAAVRPPDPIQLLMNAEETAKARAVLWRLGIARGDRSVNPELPPATPVEQKARNDLDRPNEP